MDERLAGLERLTLLFVVLCVVAVGVAVAQLIGIAMGPVHRFEELVTETDTAMFADERNRSRDR